MRVPASEPPAKERESGEGKRREAAPEGAREMSADLVMQMQAGAGNAVVARMLVARAIDYGALAAQVHDAVAGLGTDEEAVYAALAQLNHDPAASAALSRTYLSLYGETLEAAIQDDFSGEELERAMGLLGTRTGPATPPAPTGALSPAVNTERPQHPPRSLPMDRATGAAVLTGAFGDITSISPGRVEILAQEEFQAAYDRIYGATQYSWALYVAPGPGNLNGFAHEGVNYINSASAGLHTVVHEMLHNNTAADWRAVVGSRWDEGTTEVLTQEACAQVAEPAPTCYPGESPVVRHAIAQGLSMNDLKTAYLTGGAQAKVANWVDANCTENWAAVKGHMEANDWAAARAGLQRKP